MTETGPWSAACVRTMMRLPPLARSHPCQVTPDSGKTAPVCGLFAHPVGCASDPNQWAGTKAPLPLPGPSEGVTQTWVLPLSWLGSSVAAVSLSPDGPVPGVPEVLLSGRNLTLVGVQPAWPVRLTRA